MAFRDLKVFKQLAAEIPARIKKECPKVVWKSSFTTPGRFDVVDVVEANDPKQIERAAMIIHACTQATTGDTYCNAVETIPCRALSRRRAEGEF